MALQKLALRPGVNRQVSQTLNEGGWYDSSRVRWRSGVPQKLGGWVRWLPTTLLGICRAIHAWAQINSVIDVGFATTDHLYVAQGGTLYDITPIRATIAVNAHNIVVTNGSKTVTTTTASAHGLTMGDYVTWDAISGTGRTPSGITVGGITLSGDYIVTATTSATVFTVTAANAANANTNYAGTATVTAFLAAGLTSTVRGTGWGAGGWGGVQGGGVTTGWGVAAPTGTSLLPARQWALDAWGQSLMAIPTQGGLYQWSPDPSTGGVTTRAALVTNAGTPGYGPPLVINCGFVAMPERHMVLLGCSALNGTANFDPLLVRWSDAEDNTTYFALATNSAGSARLQGGSMIVGALNTQAQTIIWTDTMAYTMRFINLPYVYRFDALGRDCGLIGQHGFGMLGGVVYWMSQKAFFRFAGGAPEMLPCTIWDDVLSNLNTDQMAKTTCAVNAAFGEITWYYPSSNSNEPDRYITYNRIDDCWYGGLLGRTACIDAGVTTNPLAVDINGVIFAHESGVDDDGKPMGEYAVTGYVDIADGENITFISRIVPDFQLLAGAPLLTLNATMYPFAAVKTKGPFAITNAARGLNSRLRGRQIAVRIDGGGVGSNWRLGALRLDLQPDGTR